MIKFGIQKEMNEIEMGREVMRTLESKFGMSDQIQKLLISEKIGRIHEHNSDIVERK